MKYRSNTGAPLPLQIITEVCLPVLQLASSRTLGQPQQVVQLKAQMLWRNRASKHENRKPVMLSQGFGRRQIKGTCTLLSGRTSCWISQQCVGSRFCSGKETGEYQCAGGGHGLAEGLGLAKHCQQLAKSQCGPCSDDFPAAGSKSCSSGVPTGLGTVVFPEKLMGETA